VVGLLEAVVVTRQAIKVAVAVAVEQVLTEIFKQAAVLAEPLIGRRLVVVVAQVHN
jgi:hypothetical protein